MNILPYGIGLREEDEGCAGGAGFYCGYCGGCCVWHIVCCVQQWTELSFYGKVLDCLDGYIYEWFNGTCFVFYDLMMEEYGRLNAVLGYGCKLFVHAFMQLVHAVLYIW